MKRRKPRKSAVGKAGRPPARIGGGALRGATAVGARSPSGTGQRAAPSLALPSSASPTHAASGQLLTTNTVTDAKTVGPPRRRVRWMRGLALCVVIFAAAAFAMLYVASRTPSWYRVPDVPVVERQSVRDDLERMTNRFSMALLGTDPFEICFDDVQLTRWLSARASIWPAAERMIPSEWKRPMIRFESGRIIVAARYEAIRQAPVVSLELAADADGERITVRPLTLRIGSLALPVSWMTRWTHQLRIAERAADSGVELTGSIDAGFSVSARQRWWNGKRPFVVRDIRIDHGELCAEIVPLARESR